MPTPPSPDPTPESLLAGYLAKRSAGAAADFQSYCDAHPQHARALRELLGQHDHLQAVARTASAGELDPVRGAKSAAGAPSFAARLKQKYGAGVDPQISLDAAPGASSAAEQSAPFGSAATDALVQRLREHSLEQSRYQLEGELARGGMGAILKIWDEDLRRHLAMKVILGRGEAPGAGGTPAVEPHQLARFLEEAQVTGQLDHPGIVPVHELGLDGDGRVYFTMKLVKGRDLKAVFELVFAEAEGWNETRALSVILRACEAMAYAHKKGVIHRDLKPGNIMVGNFGEVYVMDWGLARVLGKEDRHDIRIAPELATALSSVKTERREEREEQSDSPVVTMDGDVVGTPAYMPPEQARGEIDKLGPRSDVYAIGAMLYHLLTRQVPYVPRGTRLSNRTVLGLVVNGPPTPITTLRKDVPAELVAIVEKAMAREPAQRYADTLALAEDLRAFLEHRVVGAYETGAWAETRKWVERNKPLAASLAAAVVLLVAGLTASLVFKARADENALRAGEKEREATQKTRDVLSLSAIQDLQDLVDEADRLWPAHPETSAAYAAWLEKARVLIEGRPGDEARGVTSKPSLADHEAKLRELEERALPQTEQERERERDVNQRREWTFASGEDRWWHAQLSKLVKDLRAFTDEPTGGLFSGGVSEQHGWGIVKRAEFARTIEERSVSGAEAQRGWVEALEAIAKSEKYRAARWDGVGLEPQLGLLPIGADPASGLWEFAHLMSGDVPERDAHGKLVLKAETCIVLVLIPGGSFTMGAQKTDPTAPNHDEEATSDETPHDVTLSAYFVSKYEMTQGQWERLSGRNPSSHGPGRYSTTWNRAGQEWTALHPVELVTWTQCMELMGRAGLAQPSEAQWEHAARAGTSSVHWTGDDLASLAGAANLSDAYGKSHGNDSWPVWEPDFDDGNTAHAEVGSYRANAFGLHDVHGNVWEWCLDGYDSGFYGTGPQVDPVSPWSGAKYRVYRGGGFYYGASLARSALRRGHAPESQLDDLGLRPARPSSLPASSLHLPVK